MTYIRKFKRKNKDGTIKTYYAEVESVREGDKIVQKYIRSLGTDPTNPTNYSLEPVHFSYLALRLMQGNLTANDVFEMLEGMGNPVISSPLLTPASRRPPPAPPADPTRPVVSS